MRMKNRQKQYSIIITIAFLVNLIAPLTTPMVALAETEDNPEENVLSVAAAIAQENNDREVTVEGYYVDSEAVDIDITEDTEDTNNLIGLLADDPNELEDVLFVEMTENLFDELSLEMTSENISSEKITLTGTLNVVEDYFYLENATNVDSLDEISNSDVQEPVSEEAEESEPEESVEEENDIKKPVDDETDTEVKADEAGHTIEEASLMVAQQSTEPFDLSVLHMNDTHARVANYPHMVTAINENYQDNSLVLHAGDVFSGTLYFNEFQGEADKDLLNLMRIDAMVFGNHEFDLGDTPDGHQALANFVQETNFPLLGTNVDFSNDTIMAPLETNESLVENPNSNEIYDSIVLDVQGEKIGVFGLVTEDTKDIASPVNVTFSNYIDAAEEAVTEFEQAGIDKVIALTHIGYDSAPVVGNDLLLADYVEGIDIIVGSHSHTALEDPVIVNQDSEPTVIVQAGENAEHLGSLNVQFDENGVIVSDEVSGDLISILPDEEDDLVGYSADTQAEEVLMPYKNQVDAVNNEEIGATAEKDLLNPRHGEGNPTSVRADETPLGNLVTDAMLAKAQEKFPEAVIAFQNGGGIRAPIAEGPITTGEVIEVLPFGNNPVIAELSGQEIVDLLEISIGDAPEENGGFLHVSGMQYYYDSHAEPGNRVRRVLINQNGEDVELDPNETYLVTTNGFTGIGRDGLTPFADANERGDVRDIGEIDWEQLRDYMIEEEYLNGSVNPVVEGRIIDLEGEPLPGDYESIIQSLQERLTGLEERIDNLEQQNQVQANELTNLRNQLAALRVELENSDVALENIEGRVLELEEALAALENQVPEGEKEKEKEKEDTTEEVTSDNQESSTSEEKAGSLPKTGMNVVIPLASGATLLISGLGLEAYRKKKYNK